MIKICIPDGYLQNRIIISGMNLSQQKFTDMINWHFIIEVPKNIYIILDCSTCGVWSVESLKLYKIHEFTPIVSKQSGEYGRQVNPF